MNRGPKGTDDREHVQRERRTADDREPEDSTRSDPIAELHHAVGSPAVQRLAREGRIQRQSTGHSPLRSSTGQNKQGGQSDADGISAKKGEPGSKNQDTGSKNQDAGAENADAGSETNASSETGASSPLSPPESREAISYNNERYQNRRIRWIQDVVGVSVTGSMDAATVRMIATLQSDHGLTVDGKVGRYTLEPICDRLIREGNQNRAINLIVDGHDMPTGGLANGLQDIYYEPTLTNETGLAFPSGTVKIGPPAFESHEQLVHTVRHELEHVEQAANGETQLGAPDNEFQGEATEILSQGMQLESPEGFMKDVKRAKEEWDNMTPVEQNRNSDTFSDVRDEVRRRLDPLPDDELNNRTVWGETYEDILEYYNDESP